MNRFLAVLALVAALACGVAWAADLSVTAGSVVPVTGYGYIDLIAGTTLTAGQVCYQASSDSKAYKTDCDSATAEVRRIKGVALNGASAGQPVRLQTSGDVNIGATLTVGEIYCASNTAGGAMPKGDLSTGEYVQILGVATTASNLKLSIFNSDTATP